MKFPEYLAKLRKLRLFYIRRILGNSMYPRLKPGDVVLALPLSAQPGDIVIARYNGKEIIKRVIFENENSYVLVGDNRPMSTDSRKFGPVKKENIVGRVMFKLPTPTEPVRPKNTLGKVFNYALLIVLMILILLQLTGLGEMIRDLNLVLPGGALLASWATVLILLTEILALPYLFFARLSLLGHAVSGYFTVLAPIEWTLITIWAYSQAYAIGIAGSVVEIKSSTSLLVAMAVWLVLAYITLWLRNYGQTFTNFHYYHK